MLGALVALAAVLGVLQYGWIGEVSVAERERIKAGLETSLHRLSQDFNAEITSACIELMPVASEVAQGKVEEAYAARYARWRHSSDQTRLFRRIALAVPVEGSVALRNLDLDKGIFEPAEWPTSWTGLRDRLTSMLPGEGPRPRRRPEPRFATEPALLELPRFPRFEADGPPPMPPSPERRERMEMDWLILELDLDYVRSTVIPEFLQRHLAVGGRLDYQAEIIARDEAATLIYRSSDVAPSGIGSQADASVHLFTLQYDQLFGRVRPFGPRGARGPDVRGQGDAPPMGFPDRGRWQLSVRHRAGSLAVVVARARRLNLLVASAILILMLATVVMLVRFTRRAQHLARLQMEFVAGVSHELRTPLSVIRTAAHNLGGGVVKDQKQMQRYGSLIREEAERLTGIVEQVLRFANAQAGRAIGAREPVFVPSLVAEAVGATSAALDESGCELEQHVDPNLPPVLADSTALRHAIQNLLSNAAKYGADGKWIGISASLPSDGTAKLVEIRVADHGMGIPDGDLEQVFDPFYRGKRAIEDQIHGTGLGLSLVRRIVEAHGGTVTVHSEPGKGTEFVLRIPAAPEELWNEFTDPASRG